MGFFKYLGQVFTGAISSAFGIVSGISFLLLLIGGVLLYFNKLGDLGRRMSEHSASAKVVALIFGGLFLVNLLVVTPFLLYRKQAKELVAQREQNRLLASNRPRIDSVRIRRISPTGTHFGWEVLEIRNEGHGALFWATFTLSGGLVADRFHGVGIPNFNIGPFHAWWSRSLDAYLSLERETGEAGAPLLPHPGEIRLGEGEIGYLYLVNIPSNFEQETARIASTTATGRVGVAFQLNWNREAPVTPRDWQSCELVLRVFSDPDLQNGPWQRRFRIDLDGVHEIKQ